MIAVDAIDIAVMALELTIKVSIVLVLGILLSRSVRSRFPSGAHLTWVLAFATIITIPFVAQVVPGRSILNLNLKPEVKFRQSVRRGAVSTSSSRPDLSQSESGGSSAITQVAIEPTNTPPILVILALEAPWLVTALAVWVIGVLVVTSRALLGMLVLLRLRFRGTRVFDSISVRSIANRISAKSGLARRYDLRICTTGKIPVPMTWGALKPTIVVPTEASEWTETRLEATLLHELSHIRRCDFVCQLIGEFACALYWFHPLAWYAARTMREDAELAADEAVLQTGLKPSDYAAELLKIAADLGNKPMHFATLGTPAMTNSKIETRLESILAPNAGTRGVTTLQVLAALLFVAVTIPTFASLHLSPASQQKGDVKPERTEALNRAKQIALATIMYASDADDYIPYVQQTASAVQVLQPYTKSEELYESPTKGGKFNFNLNLAGVALTAIENPAETPLWYETLPDPKMLIAVSYVDGHASLIDPNALPEADKKGVVAVQKDDSAKPISALKLALKRKFPRDKGMKPLPANYLLPIKP